MAVSATSPASMLRLSGARSRYTWRMPENPEMPAAAYLLSDDAKNVTAATLYVDSGYHSMGM